jgi:hypothetical protein
MIHNWSNNRPPGNRYHRQERRNHDRSGQKAR